MEPERKCFRLMGGVLVERTVGEVLPAVNRNREGLEMLIAQVGKQIKAKNDNLLAFQEKYSIRIKNQGRSASAPQEAKEGGSKSQGVLA